MTRRDSHPHFIFFPHFSLSILILLLASLHPLKHSLSAELYHFIHFYDFILQVDLAADTVNVFFWAYLRADPFRRLLFSCFDCDFKQFLQGDVKKMINEKSLQNFPRILCLNEQNDPEP